MRPSCCAPCDSWTCPCRPKQRLGLLDEVAHGSRADRPDLRLAALGLHPELAVDQRRLVELGRVRRRMQHGDQVLGILDAGEHIRDPVRQLLLGELARAIATGVMFE